MKDALVFILRVVNSPSPYIIINNIILLFFFLFLSSSDSSSILYFTLLFAISSSSFLFCVQWMFFWRPHWKTSLTHTHTTPHTFLSSLSFVFLSLSILYMFHFTRSERYIELENSFSLSWDDAYDVLVSNFSGSSCSYLYFLDRPPPHERVVSSLLHQWTEVDVWIIVDVTQLAFNFSLLSFSSALFSCISWTLNAVKALLLVSLGSRERHFFCGFVRFSLSLKCFLLCLFFFLLVFLPFLELVSSFENFVLWIHQIFL